MKNEKLLFILISLVAVFAVINVHGQTLMPDDMSGKENYGQAVAANGQFAFVANDVTDADGEVHIFKAENNTWTKTQVLTKANTCADDGDVGTTYGTAIASDGDWLAVSAPYHYITCDTRGVVYFYKHNGDAWEYHSQVNDTASIPSNFGSCLSMDNEKLAIGANRYIKDYDTEEEVLFMGAVSVFAYNEISDAWELEVYITNPTERRNARFGSNVCLSGDWLMTSVSGEPLDGESFTGLAYFYHYSSGSWFLKQQYYSANSYDDTKFAESIAIQGDFAFASYQLDSDYGYYHVEVLKRNGETWERYSDLSSGVSNGYNRFGTDMALHNEFLAVSSTYTGGSLRDKNGKVDLFVLEEDNWSKVKEYDNPIRNEEDQFGEQLAVCDSGLIVGAPGYDTPAFNTGAAHVFSDYNHLPSVTAWFDASAMIIHPDTEVTFTDKSTAQLTNITDWYWFLDNDKWAYDVNQVPAGHKFTSPGHHRVRLKVTDNLLNDVATRYITVLPEDRALYTDYISFAGTENDNQGIVAWNGNDENGVNRKIAHELPMPPASIDEAYYYLASRDYLVPSANSGISANSAPVNWPFLTQALTDNGKSINDIHISFGVSNLGNDTRSIDWQLTDNEEWRIYTGGTFSIKLGDEEIIYGEMPDLTLNIAYYAAQGGTDSIEGETTVADLTNCSNGKSAEAQAIATAIMNDVNGGVVKFMFSSIQSANQLEFEENGRYGGYFDVMQGFLIKNPPCALVVDAGDDVRVQENTNVTLNVDVKYNEGGLTYLWEPSVGLDDPTLKKPTFNSDQSKTYTVTVTDEHECQDQDQVNVNVVAAPEFTNNICESEIVPFPTNDLYLQGSEVCINGNFAFVYSLVLANPSGGQVRVFKLEEGAWVQTQLLGMYWEEASDVTPFHSGFGHSLDSEGDWLIVGAPVFGPDPNSNTWRDGVVFIYKRNGNAWEYHSKLYPEIKGVDFGYEVSVSGNRLAVGYRFTYVGAYGSATDGGKVYTYEYSSADDTWNNTQILRPDNLGENDGFGKTLKLEGNNLIIGAPEKTMDGIRNAGAAYFYEHNGNAWVQRHTFTTETPEVNDYYGADIALSGNYAMVEHNLNNVRVFERSTVDGNWSKAQDIAMRAVYDISIDGEFAVISDAWKETVHLTGEASSIGWTQLYKLENGFWSLVDTIIPSYVPDRGANYGYHDPFGYKVDMDGGKIIVGVSENPWNSFAGEAYFEYQTAFVYSGFGEYPTLSADFSFDPALAALGDIQYTDLSTANNTSITSWSWDFDGDGTEDSDQQNPLHQFAFPGTYPVTLTVSDGEVYDVKTRWVTSMDDKMDSCIAYIPFRGVEANRQGVAAWNTNSTADEPEETGHALQQPPASIEVAYHYMASRDYDDIDPEAPAAMTANGPAVNWSNLSQALADNGKSIEDLQISFGLASLGNDVDGQDWELTDNKEWRKYTGGSFHIRLNGEDMISGPMPELTLDIEYNAYLGGDDEISGETGFTYPQNNSAASSATAQAIAAAFMLDCGDDPIKLFFASLQPALQTEFWKDGREGGFFDVEQGYLIKSCQCSMELDVPDDYYGSANEDIQINMTINGGTEPYDIQWFPATGLNDATARDPIANLQYNMTYTVTVTDANDCSTEDEVFVHIGAFTSIDGYIRNQSTLDPIAMAEVELYTDTMIKSTYTASNGYYCIDGVAPDADYKIIVHATDYNEDSVLNVHTEQETICHVDLNLRKKVVTSATIVKSEEIVVYFNGNSISVNAKNGVLQQVSVYGGLGRLVEESDRIASQRWNSEKPMSPKLYFIKVQTLNKTLTKTVLVK